MSIPLSRPERRAALRETVRELERWPELEGFACLLRRVLDADDDGDGDGGLDIMDSPPGTITNGVTPVVTP
jgi:hypothetical protein